MNRLLQLGIFGCLWTLSQIVSANDKPATAADNVIVLEAPFTISALQRQRTIRLYLPPNYANSAKAYPVLYMHDAQNLFDTATSYAGEWNIDESLNHLSKTLGFELIVVGIDNGAEKRMNELSPWPNEHFGKAEGDAYLDFIVNTVKPYIDQHYRTLTDTQNTAIFGSSMGGLISHYAIHRYPRVFGKAGIFSPSYWYSESVYQYTLANPLSSQHRLYINVGLNEGVGMVQPLQSMVALLRKQDSVSFFANVEPEGDHNEASWRRQFPKAILWLFQYTP